MSQDTFAPSGEQAEKAAAPGRPSIDRFELDRQWTERAEEERVEEAAVLYEKAVRQRLPAPPPEVSDPADLEELETRSQALKLRQMCQGIAAQVMVEELEDDAEEEQETQ